MEVVRLLTEFQKEPLCICQNRPAFSWNVESAVQVWTQEAYRVIVSEAEAGLELVAGDGAVDPDRLNLSDNVKDGLKHNSGLMWDSGKQMSAEMVNITYGGRPLRSDTQYYWKVIVWGSDGAGQAASWFKTALYEPSDWHGLWLGEQEDHTYHIYRKSFELKSGIASASLYVCGLGHYEFYMNGQRVSDRVLEPGWTNYHKSCLYSCYDVTGLLHEGVNGAGLILGDGMFNVPGGRYVYFPRSFGKCKFLVQMNIVYEDGSRDEIVSDLSWKMAKSALTFSCIYGGEDFDARLWMKGFSREAFTEDARWETPVATDAPKGRLTAQNTEPLKVMEHYDPVNVREVAPGKYLYDFGRNFSGWICARLACDTDLSGHEVVFTPGEILDENGLPDQRVTGKGYQWKYILDDTRTHVYHPRFTYTGFRYVLVEGAMPGELADRAASGAFAEDTAPATRRQSGCQRGAAPVIEAITGEFIYPDNIENGGFYCSNPLFNDIHNIICQAILSNTKSISTDCPHREKLPWMEQTHLIGPGIMYNYNVHNLYEKIEQDMVEAQHDNGLIPDICPQYVTFGYHEGFNDSPEWGSAGIINPWYLYKRYGDREIFVRYYDSMKKYMDYLTGKTYHHILHHGLGDWLDIGPMTPYSQNTPVPVIATNIYYYDLGIMRRVAEMLGRTQDAHTFEVLMAQVYEEYDRQFFDDQTNRYANGSQAAQAMSLVSGLVRKGREDKVLEMLVKDIQLRGYQTTAGDIGHPFVMAALMQYGRGDMIDAMTNVTDKPGYGYQVRCGATTLTEEWDGPNPERPHGSQNHLMLGSVEEWFYGGLAGIHSIRTDQSFDEILIRPYFAQSCDFVEAWTMHPYGRIELRWERRDDRILLDFQIPANARARFVNACDGREELLGSGSYHYELQNGKAE